MAIVATVRSALPSAIWCPPATAVAVSAVPPSTSWMVMFPDVPAAAPLTAIDAVPAARPPEYGCDQIVVVWMAVVADMGASLLVIANALRLLRE